MARLNTISRDQLPEYEKFFQEVEKSAGFVPNSWLTMAHVPPIMEAFAKLSATIMRTTHHLPQGLKALVAHVASRTAGCQYCTLHTLANNAAAVPDQLTRDKLDAVWEYETSPLFSDAERCALALAQNAAQVPNQVTDEEFEELKKHFTEPELVELVAVISMFGFLNRWNDTMATELEEEPLAFAEDVELASHGWNPAKHVK